MRLVVALVAVAACSLTGGAARATTVVTTAGVDPSSTNGTFSISVSGPTTILSGQKVTYKITIKNTDTSPLGSFSASNGFTPAASTTSYGSMAGNGVGCGTTTDVGLSCDDLPVGKSESFKATFTAPTVNDPTAAQDEATASTQTDNGTADLAVTLNPSADLGVTSKVADQGPVKVTGSVVAGNHVRYTVVVTNNGPSDVPDVSVSDSVPSQLTGVEVCEGAGCDPTNSGINFAPADPLVDPFALTAHSSQTFVIDGLLPSSDTPTDGPLANSATVSSGTTTDTKSANNTATNSTPIATRADLAVTTTVADQGPVKVTGSVVAGNHVRYTVVVTNNGPSDVPDVSVSDSVPSQLTGVEVCEGAGCDPTNSGINFAPADPLVDPFALTAHSSQTFVIDGLLPPSDLPPDSLTNTAGVSSSSVTDPKPASNSVTKVTPVATRADLGVTATVADQGPVKVAKSVVAGNHVRYTIVVTNNGPSDAQNVAVDDTLPSQLTGVKACEGTGCDPTDSGQNFDPGHPLVDPFPLPSGASQTFIVDGLLPASDVTPDSLSNTASATSDTTDPKSSNNNVTTTTTIVARADLAVSSTVADQGPVTVSGKLVAGNHVRYTIVLANNGPSDAQNVAVHDTVPPQLTGVKICEGSGCDPTDSGQNFDPADPLVLPFTLAAGASQTFIVDGLLPSDKLPVDGPVVNVASVSSDTQDQVPSNNSSTRSTPIDTRADLQVLSETADTDPAYADGTTGTETFHVEITNTGPSDARSVGASATGLASPSTLPAWILDSGTSLGDIPAGTTETVDITAHANPQLGHAPPTPIKSGPLFAASSVKLTSTTKDQNPANNVDPTALSDSAPPNGVEIDTAPSPPLNPFAIPGSTNVILTWETPAHDGGQPIDHYEVTVDPPDGGTGGGSFSVPVGGNTSFCGNVAAQDCYQQTIGGLSNDIGDYTFTITAVNAVGPSDGASAQAQPSANADNASVASGAADTLSTCTTATPDQPVCVQFSIPGGGTGGVFGAEGNVPLTANLCGTGCVTNSGAQNLGSLAGYNDPTDPLVETITWDASTIDPSYAQAPLCPNNSTSLTCYPNNVPFYYLMSFAIPSGAAGTKLNLHFCANSIANGGAGNMNFARPKPQSGGLAKFNGYADSAGSACIKHTNVLGSTNSPPNANGDVQLQINLTSDSDALQGHR